MHGCLNLFLGETNKEELAQKIQEFTSQQAVPVSPKESKEEEEAERKRSNMRMALARRMKMDLVGNEEDKKSRAREDQFSELDKKLKEVETLRSLFQLITL